MQLLRKQSKQGNEQYIAEMTHVKETSEKSHMLA